MDTSFVPGWAVSIPLVILTAVWVWALIKGTEPEDMPTYGQESEKYRLPPLPENQRWEVSRAFFILDVRLQEKRWWGWRTIAQSSDYVTGGAAAVARCVEHILNREMYARLRAEAERKEAETYAQIPFGKHRGGEQ